MTQASRAGSSPHTRGALGAGRAAARVPGIIPAYAGSTHQPIPRVSLMKDHPRIRGEHAAGLPTDFVELGSSPHTRGARITSVDYEYLTTDHPRIRGEHAVDVGPDRRRRGSSPHTRGARLTRYLPKEADRIIPAYAGSTS